MKRLTDVLIELVVRHRTPKCRLDVFYRWQSVVLISQTKIFHKFNQVLTHKRLILEFINVAETNQRDAQSNTDSPVVFAFDSWH